ncbi:MAG: HNH endonuclease [Pyrinomonadaceae bacterium]|nr:HNH endonuclease [Pyrinomonadaceae bacterium]
MSRYINEKVRTFVETRAEGICEYCLINISDTYFGGEIDHIISLKHGGKSVEENLAVTCQPCNRNKGSDLGSISIVSNELVRFFNPRKDIWCEHFKLVGAEIVSLSEIGEVTAKIFGFNDDERVLERKGLIEIEHFPSETAQKIIDLCR